MRILTWPLPILFVIAFPASGRRQSRQSEPPCENPLVRQEWRELSLEGRLDFIAAVKCLQVRPGETSVAFSGVRSRYDDFVALHISQADYVHWVGHFLPWHRSFLWLFEQALRDECSYGGSIPYWDWTQDAFDEISILESPVFDPVYGLGGNGDFIADINLFPEERKTEVDVPGRTGGGCLADGPFAGVNASMGPGNHTEYTPRCIRRDISPSLMVRALGAEQLASVLNASSYFELEHRTEGLALGVEGISVHGGGHFGIGGILGDMSNTWSSTVDPIFWLHHGSIDRMWDIWQRADWANRKTDIGGPDTQWAYPYNYFGDKAYKNITLDFEMDLGEIGGSVKIRDIMDAQGKYLCYTYS